MIDFNKFKLDDNKYTKIFNNDKIKLFTENTDKEFYFIYLLFSPNINDLRSIQYYYLTDLIKKEKKQINFNNLFLQQIDINKLYQFYYDTIQYFKKIKGKNVNNYYIKNIFSNLFYVLTKPGYDGLSNICANLIPNFKNLFPFEYFYNKNKKNKINNLIINEQYLCTQILKIGINEYILLKSDDPDIIKKYNIKIGFDIKDKSIKYFFKNDELLKNIHLYVYSMNNSMLDYRQVNSLIHSKINKVINYEKIEYFKIYIQKFIFYNNDIIYLIDKTLKIIELFKNYLVLAKKLKENDKDIYLLDKIEISKDIILRKLNNQDISTFNELLKKENIENEINILNEKRKKFKNVSKQLKLDFIKRKKDQNYYNYLDLNIESNEIKQKIDEVLNEPSYGNNSESFFNNPLFFKIFFNYRLKYNLESDGGKGTLKDDKDRYLLNDYQLNLLQHVDPKILYNLFLKKLKFRKKLKFVIDRKINIIESVDSWKDYQNLDLKLNNNKNLLKYLENIVFIINANINFLNPGINSVFQMYDESINSNDDFFKKKPIGLNLNDIITTNEVLKEDEHNQKMIINNYNQYLLDKFIKDHMNENYVYHLFGQSGGSKNTLKLLEKNILKKVNENNKIFMNLIKKSSISKKSLMKLLNFKNTFEHKLIAEHYTTHTIFNS